MFDKYAQDNNLAFYGGMRGYQTLAKFAPKLANRLGWANNYHYVSNVMKHGGRIFNVVGPATGSYGKELLLVAGYKNLVNIDIF